MARKQKNEPDSVYFLKILLYFLLGAIWIRFTSASVLGSTISIPVGLIIGLFFAHHEHFQIDRKIEFAVLLVSTTVSFFFPIGFILVI